MDVLMSTGQTDIWMSEHTDGHMNIEIDISPAIYLPNKPILHLPHACICFAYLKLTFLHLKEMKNLIESLKTALGINPHQLYP